MRDMLQEMLSWLLFNGPNNLESSDIAKLTLPWLTSFIRNDAIAACKNGYAIKLAVILDGLAIRHSIHYLRYGIELANIADNCFVFNSSVFWNYKYYIYYLASLSVVEGINGDKEVASCSRSVSYYHPYSSKRAPRENIKMSNSNEDKGFKLEQQRKGWVIASQSGCPVREFDIAKWPEIKSPDSIYVRNSRMEYLQEHFFPDNSFFKSKSKPWLLDELWLEYFGKNWIPYDLKERIAKFPDTAKFFAERYPQVVPDEAWALLGGKPAPA